MIYTERSDGFFNCIDWCDVAADDVLLGLLQTCGNDSPWLFTPLSGQPLTCRHARCISEKLSELNNGLMLNENQPKELDSDPLNEAGHAFIDAWLNNTSQKMTGETFNNLKPMINAAICTYNWMNEICDGCRCGKSVPNAELDET